jgi:murein DD-endopeptidase MepM/ murein hydrolase activator NlpD
MRRAFDLAPGLGLALMLALGACSHLPPSPYERSTPAERAAFKKVRVPLPAGTRFVISQGAFGAYTHHDEGHEYTWDFDVPYGTPVLAVGNGRVLSVWEPDTGGGCDPRYNDTPHTLRLLLEDGTVAQYVHIHAQVRPNQPVREGDVVAVTAKNGFICSPQLDFGVYRDADHLMGTGQPRSIPLLFEGLPDGGMAHEGYRGQVPP